VHYGRGGFVGVALAIEFLEERETEVDVVEIFAFEQAANSDQFCWFLPFDYVEAKPEFSVARDWAVRDVGLGVGEISYASIADVFQEWFFVQELEDEGGILRWTNAGVSGAAWRGFRRVRSLAG
jgi:hypothetical protein